MILMVPLLLEPQRTLICIASSYATHKASYIPGVMICIRMYIIWDFPKIRGTLFWVLIARILLFRVLYIRVPYFRKPPYVSELTTYQVP